MCRHQSSGPTRGDPTLSAARIPACSNSFLRIVDSSRTRRATQFCSRESSTSACRALCKTDARLIFDRLRIDNSSAAPRCDVQQPLDPELHSELAAGILCRSASAMGGIPLEDRPFAKLCGVLAAGLSSGLNPSRRPSMAYQRRYAPVGMRRTKGKDDLAGDGRFAATLNDHSWPRTVRPHGQTNQRLHS